MALVARSSGASSNGGSKSPGGGSKGGYGGARRKTKKHPQAKGTVRREDTEPRCHRCGEVGHVSYGCRKNLPKKNKEVLLSAVACNYATAGNPSHWVLDSGCSQHLSPHLELISGYVKMSRPVRITVGNGQYLEALGVGDVRFTTVVGGEDISVRISGVFYTPGLVMNLLSVKKLAEARASVFFHEHGGCDLRRRGEVFAEASTDGLLPYLKVKYPESESVEACLAAAVKPSAELIHRRTAHTNYESLAKMAALDMVEGIPVSAKEFRQAQKQGPCGPCVIGKHARAPFGSSDNEREEPLQLLHMDLCGPLEEETCDGERYIATVYDDYSKFSIIKLLRKKDQVVGFVKDTIARLERQLAKKVKTIRTDRGSEYVNTKLGEFLKKHGIKHEITVAYTPQQNGAAERLNRTLLEKARTILEDAKFHKSRWGDAVLTACYVRNRVPVAGRDKTPYELFYGEKPDLSNLRVFGATAYIRVPDEKRQKLDPRSRRGLFLGYDERTKGWRVLVNDKVLIGRDVIFDERPRSELSTEDARLLVKKVTFDPAVKKDVAARGAGILPLHSVGALPPAGPATDEEEADNVDHGLDMFDSSSDDEEAPVSAGDGGASAPPAEQRYLEPQDVMDLDQLEEAVENLPGAGVKRNLPEAGEDLGSTERYPKRERRPPEFYRVVGNAFVAKSSSSDEPRSLKEALESPDAELWEKAMAEEIDSLHKNGTWVLEEPPPGVKTIPCMWLFKIKRDAHGNVERYKARLVALGNRQVAGVDFEEVYAPTSKQTSLRALLAVVAEENLELHQLDVKTAFLNGELEETVYMKQPPGYEEGGPRVACRLQKAIYGLRQAPRAWHTKLKKELEAMGFVASAADPALWVKSGKAGVVYLLVYVDDMLIATKSKEEMQRTKELVMRVFDARDLGEARMFIGFEISRDRSKKTLHITQKRLTTELLERYGMTNAKKVSVGR